MIIWKGDLIKIWNSYGQIKRETGMNYSSIFKACTGIRKTAYKFKWELL